MNMKNTRMGLEYYRDVIGGGLKSVQWVLVGRSCIDSISVISILEILYEVLQMYYSRYWDYIIYRGEEVDGLNGLPVCIF